MAHHASKVLIHVWYRPDSYDTWLPDRDFAEPEPAPAPRAAAWQIGARWLRDADLYNELMNEEDYEQEDDTDDAPAPTPEGTRARKHNLPETITDESANKRIKLLVGNPVGATPVDLSGAQPIPGKKYESEPVAAGTLGNLPAEGGAPAPAPAPASEPASTASTSTPVASNADLPALGLLQMPTGSNANAHSALARIREYAKHVDTDAAPADRSVPRVPTTQRSSAATTAESSAATSPAMDGSAWSKKVAHNAIERRYRSNINDRIAGLRDVVPALREMRPRDGTRRRRRNKAEKEELVDGVAAATKMSKATVLSKATEYICYLKSREVQLDRQVSALQMLVRSLEGGDELLAAWNAELERVDRLHPPAEAAGLAAPAGTASPVDDEDEDD